MYTVNEVIQLKMTEEDIRINLVVSAKEKGPGFNSRIRMNLFMYFVFHTFVLSFFNIVFNDFLKIAYILRSRKKKILIPT